MIILDCVQNNSSENLKYYIPLISTTVVIILFIVDRLINFNKNKKEVERNFYFKALLEPSIQQISEFYKNTIVQYKESCEKLKQNIELPHNEYLALKTAEIGKFQNIKREFEISVVFPIQMRYSLVGGQLTDILLEIEDNFTISIDKDLFSEDDNTAFQLKTANSRATFLIYLYEPIKIS